MDAPKCKICGHKHYGQGHIFDEEPVEITEEKFAVLTDVLTGNKNTAACMKWRSGNKDSYNSYMKEYMRRKRHAMQGEREEG